MNSGILIGGGIVMIATAFMGGDVAFAAVGLGLACMGLAALFHGPKKKLK